MTYVCAVCAAKTNNYIVVSICGKLSMVCSFACKDVITKGRNVDVGCGIIDGGKARDVNMCSECALFSMPFTCYVTKRDQNRTLMFVGYGRVKQEERK